jgi:hypothetical protein
VRARVRTCHELRRRSAVVGVALRRPGLGAVLASPRRWARDVARRKGGVSCVVGAAVKVALDGVGVSGDMAYMLLRPCADWCFDLDVRGCGFVGTAVCVELLDADELDGVGEEGREGVGVVTDEEEPVCELLLVLDDRLMAGGEAGLGLGVVGADSVAGTGAGCSLTSEARYCSCRDASDVERR